MKLDLPAVDIEDKGLSMRGLMGKKVGMTRVFRENNDVVPVTVIEVLPCTVIQIKSKNVDGYDAVQVGSGFKSEKKVSLSVKAHCKKAGVGVFRHLREFESVPGLNINQGKFLMLVCLKKVIMLMFQVHLKVEDLRVLSKDIILGVNVKLTEMDTLKKLQVLSDKLLTQVGFFLV